MKMTVFPIIGVALGIAFSSFFTQEVASAEKAQRLCLVNSPAELIACRRGDSLYYQQPGLVHGKYLLDFAAQYCDTNFEINIQFPYVLCVYSGVKEKIAAQEVRRKEIESNMLSALRKIDNELDNPDSGWKQMRQAVVRELLSNAFAHQDLSSEGDGIVIEVFKNRVEITNSGLPVLDPLHFLDGGPAIKNEKIFSEMKNLGLVDGQGHGWRKIVKELESRSLPVPEIKVRKNSITVTLWFEKPLKLLSFRPNAQY